MWKAMSTISSSVWEKRPYKYRRDLGTGQTVHRGEGASH